MNWELFDRYVNRYQRVDLDPACALLGVEVLPAHKPYALAWLYDTREIAEEFAQANRARWGHIVVGPELADGGWVSVIIASLRERVTS